MEKTYIFGIAGYGDPICECTAFCIIMKCEKLYCCLLQGNFLKMLLRVLPLKNQIKSSPGSLSESNGVYLPLTRDRNSRAALFDGIEEGGIRASSSYSSHEIDEQENDGAIDGLQDRVNMLKRLSGDIHEEVESHNLMLDRMGNDMDSSRGVLSGTMDKFKTVFETKSSRRMFTLVASFVVIFLVIYYLTK
ncbi:Bet1-like SNARE 1-1 [Orobanche hederae]